MDQLCLNIKTGGKMVKKVKCDFSKMGTRILPKPGRHPERYKKIEKEKKNDYKIHIKSRREKGL